MCIALPMQVLSIDGGMAAIGVEDLQYRASLMLVPEAAVGDWVLVHAGCAITVLAEHEARETLALLSEIAEYDAPAGPGEDER